MSPEEDVFPNADVARRFGVSIETLRWHKSAHRDVLREGEHWIRAAAKTRGGPQRTLCWTRQGILELCIYIRTPESRTFRLGLIRAGQHQQELIAQAAKEQAETFAEIKRQLQELLNPQPPPPQPPPGTDPRPGSG